MDTSSSDASSDSSDSATDSASVSVDSPSVEDVDTKPATETSAASNSATIDEEDSDSDISLSEETDEQGEDQVRTPTVRVNFVGRTEDRPSPQAGADTPAESTNKRKYEEPIEQATDGYVEEAQTETRKRLKPESISISHGTLPSDKSLFPAEIWHLVFTFVPPRYLGLLLRVNKSFNAYLDASSPFTRSLTPLSSSASKLLKPDAIWKASRVLSRSGMPTPLAEKSELDMWKLAYSSACQFCGKKRQPASQPVDQWHPGPGENGNAPMWSFGTRTCGPCLQKNSAKEIDLLLSTSVPSILIPALPFVFLTNELHVLPATTLQNGHSPSNLRITKHYSHPQIEEIKREFVDVQAMGTATAEEWIKGLDERGKKRRGDAVRWEKWEVAGGIARIRAMELNEGVKNEGIKNEGVKSEAPTRTTTPSTTSTTFAQVSQQPNGHNLASQQNQPSHLPQAIQSSFPMKPPARFDSPAQNVFGSFQRPQAPPRVERTKEEVVELKAARRAEIERRCLALNPPLTAGVLAHMSSFQAAIQIIQPLNDGAWDVLKPRLLSQRQDAEQRENDRLAQSRVVQEHLDEQHRSQNVNMPLDSKEILDREWDDVQAPLRVRLGGYADETIRDGWSNGEKVVHDNCPTFAADVLVYVRKRFYAEVAKDEAAVRATGREPELDPPSGPYTRKLILENMKWVFDTKIKPHTEHHRKELFLCNDCEVNLKFYGFEGVIQHFAAKHTTILSSGSVVVHWRAEWPEYPPFDPEPANASTRISYHAAAPSASAAYAPPAAQQNYGYGGYQQLPVTAPMPAPNTHVYQESPRPYYGNPNFGDQYSGHQGGPYAPPPQPYQDISGGYQPQYSVPPPAGNVMVYNEPLQNYPQQAFGGQYPASTQGMYASPNPGHLYPSTVPEIAPQHYAYAPQGGQNGYPYSQPIQQPANPTTQFPSTPVKTEEYKAQLQEVARNARAVWDSIYNLKDVPGSVKVYTIIYHVLQKSRAMPEDVPSLSMIIDGLSNNKDMRKVRNVNGLLCKACILGLPGSTPTNAKKHQSFPQLANHFLRDHEKARINGGTLPDWTRDMIKLPDLKQLNAIPTSRGMDDKKLKLIAEALPEIFPPSSIKNEGLEYSGGSRAYLEPSAQESYDLAPSRDSHDKYYTAVGNDRPAVDSGTHDNGQYDPRNPRDPRDREPRDGLEPSYRIVRRADEYSEPTYAERKERDGTRYEHRPASPPNLVRAADLYGRVVVHEDEPIYMERPRRHLEEPEIEYRVRRDRPALVYGEPDRDYRVSNFRSYQSNRNESPQLLATEASAREIRYLPAEEAATTRQNRISDVVAQISQQAKHARDRESIKMESVDGGSEDGELRPLPMSHAENGPAQEYHDASKAADRFLDTFQAGETSKSAAPKQQQGALTQAEWEGQRLEDRQRMYDIPREAQRHVRDQYDEEGRSVRGRLIGPDDEHSRFVIHERAPPPQREARYPYEDHYIGTAPEAAASRDKSPELVDRRFKLNNVVYREERQGSHGMHRTPSRYARYESVRLENDRARSRSPVYVKMAPQAGQYRDRSPAAHPQPEPIYRSRTPQPPAEEAAYERAPPRQEFYRVYPDDRPQYIEVQVSDSNGDYMIRRPVRREREPEPVYARFEDERYTRQPVYESRPPPSRSDQRYPEEYDPRNPGPPVSAEGAPIGREVRYQ